MRGTAVFALFLSIAGWASQLLLVKQPSLRATLWPMFLILAAALALAVSALVRDPKPTWPTRILAVFAVLFSSAIVPAYFFMLRVPAPPGRPAVGLPMPEVNVLNHLGERISTAGYAGNGPVLVVFYRGFW